jgi:hypothetical protein
VAIEFNCGGSPHACYVQRHDCVSDASCIVRFDRVSNLFYTFIFNNRANVVAENNPTLQDGFQICATKSCRDARQSASDRSQINLRCQMTEELSDARTVRIRPGSRKVRRN